MLASHAAQLSTTFSEEDYDLAGAEAPNGEIEWFSVEAVRTRRAFALTIVCLRDRIRFPGRLILQQRTKANSASGYGLYSNVSGRVRLHDVLLPSGEQSTVDRLSDECFRYAAARELLEETYIDAEDGQFKLWDSFRAELAEKTAECRVFVADLNLAEHGAPEAGLETMQWLAKRDLYPLDGSEIEDLIERSRVNTVLAQRWRTTFAPLIGRSAIVEELPNR